MVGQEQLQYYIKKDAWESAILSFIPTTDYYEVKSDKERLFLCERAILVFQNYGRTPTDFSRQEYLSLHAIELRYNIIIKKHC